MAQSHRIYESTATALRPNQSDNISLSRWFAAIDNLVAVCGYTKIQS